MKKTILAIVSFVVGLAGIALAQEYDYGSCPMGGMMYGFSGGYGGGAMAFSWIFGILIIAALSLSIVWLAKQVSKR